MSRDISLLACFHSSGRTHSGFVAIYRHGREYSPGEFVDSTRYYVALADAMGNGVSSSPSNSREQPRMKFREFTILDMVEAGHRLLTEVLHILHLRVVMEVSMFSMGGMQGFGCVLKAALPKPLLIGNYQRIEAARALLARNKGICGIVSRTLSAGLTTKELS